MTAFDLRHVGAPLHGRRHDQIARRARHRRVDDHGRADGDPLDGLVNLFDIGIILSVGFLLAALSSLNLTDEVTSQNKTQDQPTAPKDSVVTNPDETTQQITIEPG